MKAAGIVVGRFGAATVTPQELKGEILGACGVTGLDGLTG
jgi:bifunctional ADP-heptose synthase (sugar kinase/adenylyltransferase)